MPDTVIIALVMPAIFLMHAVYYRFASRRSTQQQVEIVDHSALGNVVYPEAWHRQDESPVTRLPVETMATSRHAGDLVITGNERHVVPVKVCGDLIVAGDAVFTQAVTVNGCVHIKGNAKFVMGLLCKQDVVVDGAMEIGAEQRPGWIVARDVQVNGVSNIHGNMNLEKAIA